MPRLTDAEIGKQFLFSDDAFWTAGRISRFFNRVIQGQEQDTTVWRLLASAFHFLDSYKVQELAREKDESPYSFFELIFGVRLLSRLGYTGEMKSDINAIIANDSWDALPGDSHKKILEAIFHKGIEASQL